MAEASPSPSEAEVRGFVEKLRAFRSELSTNEQEMLDGLTAAASGAAEVQGFFYQQFFDAWQSTQDGGGGGVTPGSRPIRTGGAIKVRPDSGPAFRS